MIKHLHELQKQFHKFIQLNHLIKEGEKVLLAVSGGLDSMVMLELFHHSSYQFAVAHCNFGLREEESDSDEDFVTQWTKERGVECFVKKVNIEGNSIQLEAREKRYKWFDELCVEKGFSRIATAHHLNDSLETTLLNLSRGTGIKGLAGIPVQNDKIIRPLLFASRDEISVFAIDHNIQWREDASNAKVEYDRNKVRLEVIPKISELNNSLENTFKYTKERLDLTSDLVKNYSISILEQHFDKNENELHLGWVHQNFHVLILNEILSRYGFNYVSVKGVYEAIGKSGKVFESDAWKVVMDRESLFIRKRQAQDIGEVVIASEGVFEFGNEKLRVEILAIETGESNWKGGNEHIGVFDRSKLTFPLKLRKWEQGDIFQPLGMKGRKKVSDLLVDLKIPLAKKEKILVLESEGEIVWVVGYRISDNFKVVGDAKEVVRISF